LTLEVQEQTEGLLVIFEYSPDFVCARKRFEAHLLAHFPDFA